MRLQRAILSVASTMIIGIALHAPSAYGQATPPEAGHAALPPALSGTPSPKPHLPPKVADTSHPPFGQVVIGGGGYLIGVVFSPSKPGVTYLQCDMVGPWKRENNDAPWKLLQVSSDITPMPSFGVQAVAVHPTDDNIVYADMGNGGSFGQAMGLYKSTDAGKTFSLLLTKYTASNSDGNKPVSGSRYWGPTLSIDKNNPDVVYWGTRRDGVWRTTDAGKTFTQVLNVPHGCRNVVVDPTSKVVNGRSSTVYVGVFETGIYVSHDGGETFAFDESFKAIVSDKPTIPWMRLANDGVMYVAHNKGVARHDAIGWTDVSPTPDKLLTRAVAVDYTNSNRVIAVCPVNGKHTLFRSTDGGKTWSSPKSVKAVNNPAWRAGFTPMMGTSVVEIDPFDSSKAYFLDAFSNWETSNLWDDNVVFQSKLDGCEGIVTLSLTTAPGVEGEDIAPLFSGVSDVRGFRHHDIFEAPKEYVMADKDWTTYVHSYDFCEADPNVIYAAKSFEKEKKARILRSTDNGVTWTQMTAPLGEEPDAGGKLAVSATDIGHVVYFPGNRQSPMYSEDGAVTWKPSKMAGSDAPVPFVYFKNSAYNYGLAHASDRVDGNAFYAYVSSSSQNLKPSPPAYVMVSRDGGKTWRVTKSDFPNANVHDSLSPVYLIPSPTRAGELWLSAGMSGLWKSTDFGETFSKVDAFPGSRPLLVAIGAPDPSQGTTAPAAIYVYGKGADGMERGLHVSVDDGKTWSTARRAGADRLGAMHFAADRQTFGRVYFGTGGHGIWYAQVDQLLGQ